MSKAATLTVAIFAATLVVFASLKAQAPPPASAAWNSRAAATYLDQRMEWWLHWANAQRDRDTTCVSCHTVAPYAIARPILRATLAEREPAPPERVMLAHVVKRVQLWKEIDPFYNDQRSGLPKTSESRGTEAILNALVLAARDRATGSVSDDTRLAFDNLWKLQFTAGTLKGGWAWLNFHYEPWESDDATYYGATLAALAVGMAPGYASTPQIQTNLKLLQDFVQQGVDKTTPFNRAAALWAAAKLPSLLTTAQRDAAIDALVQRQQPDGGWTLSALGTFKRQDGTAIDTTSDGYGTALVTLALGSTNSSSAAASATRGRAWLRQHQDPVTGTWRAASLNKRRDPASEVGKFMNDAATAYAVMALSDIARDGSNVRH